MNRNLAKELGRAFQKADYVQVRFHSSKESKNIPCPSIGRECIPLVLNHPISGLEMFTHRIRPYLNHAERICKALFSNPSLSPSQESELQKWRQIYHDCTNIKTTIEKIQSLSSCQFGAINRLTLWAAYHARNTPKNAKNNIEETVVNTEGENI